MKLTGENRSTREKTCPSATLSTTNPTWTDLRSNPGLRGEKPATNRLSHGTALWLHVTVANSSSGKSLSRYSKFIFLYSLPKNNKHYSVQACSKIYTISISCTVLGGDEEASWSGGKHSARSSNLFLAVSKTLSDNSLDSAVSFKQWGEL
jgi:hypothetical protein